MITKDEIQKALNLFDEIDINYGKRDADAIKEIDDAIDIILSAAQKYKNLGADDYKARTYRETMKKIEEALTNDGELRQVTDEPITDNDEITIKPLKGPAKTYEAARPRGYWEQMDKDDHPLAVPMLVCSECQKTNFYPGRYCKKCGSYNSQED